MKELPRAAKRAADVLQPASKDLRDRLPADMWGEIARHLQDSCDSLCLDASLGHTIPEAARRARDTGLLPRPQAPGGARPAYLDAAANLQRTQRAVDDTHACADFVLGHAPLVEAMSFVDVSHKPTSRALLAALAPVPLRDLRLRADAPFGDYNAADLRRFLRRQVHMERLTVRCDPAGAETADDTVDTAAVVGDALRSALLHGGLPHLESLTVEVDADLSDRRDQHRRDRLAAAIAAHPCLRHVDFFGPPLPLANYPGWRVDVEQDVDDLRARTRATRLPDACANGNLHATATHRHAARVG